MANTQSFVWLGLLAILAFLIAQGRAIIDHKIHLAGLRGAFNYERRLTVSWLRPEHQRPLPSIDGVALAPERPVTDWGAALVRKGGVIVVLDAHLETSWVLARQWSRSRFREGSEPILVVLGTTSRALRLIRMTELDSHNVVLAGQSYPASAELGIRWTPAVIGIRSGLVCATAQVFSVGQLMEFQQSLVEEVTPARALRSKSGNHR